MSDIKRIQLTTVSDGKKSNDLENLSPSKTTRFEINVDLFEPNADSFPEFNFMKLLHAEKKKYKKQAKPTNGFSDPFEDNDDDVERIAKEFEKKYGGANNYSSNKKKSRPNLDYCDKGAGYDDNDSFIDNTEAYDEIIPEEIETVGGGFYINSGALEFKHLSNFERPEDALKMPKPKKRALSTSSESSEEVDEEVESDSDTENNAAKQKNGNNEKKSKVLNTEENKTNKPNKSSKDKDKKIKRDKKEELSENESSKDRDKTIKTTTVKDMLRAKRDSILNMKEGCVKSDTTPNNTDKEPNEMEQESSSSSLTSDSSNQASEGPPTENKDGEQKVHGATENSSAEVKLPAKISEKLVENISKLKELTQNSSGNVCDNNVCDLLVKIDTEARSSGSIARSQIYTYLEAFLPYTRSTLLTKLKKLRIQQEDNKICKTLNKLNNSVSEILPNIIRNYEAECQKVVEIRSTLTAEEKAANLTKMPRKRFPWNDNLRNLLFDIYNIRKASYDILKPRKETLEEFINNYLKIKVISIWPQGWMRLDELNKEIEKRKSNKKPKENKKPIEISNKDNKPPNTIVTVPAPKLNEQIIGNNIPVGSINLVKDKSVLSSNNSVLKTPLDKNLNINSVNSNQGNRNDKTEQFGLKKPGNTSSGFTNSLTITPVSSNASASSNKPLPNVENKVTITNVDPNIAMPLTNSSAAVLKEVTKNNLSSVPKLPSSLSISIQPTSTHNPTSNQNTAKETNISPPSRKTSDYSINSIMSSTSSVSNSNNHINTGHSNYSKSSSTEDLCKSSQVKENIDNIKSKHDNISPGTGNVATATQKESLIKVRSVANMNNMYGENAATNSNKAEITKVLQISDDSDSSDCVEIVGVISSKKKKSQKQSKTVSVNKINYNSTSIDAISSNTLLHKKPTQNDHKSIHSELNHINKKILINKKEELAKLSNAATNFSSNDNDLDVLQIMKDLKELQELQQPKYSTAHSIDIKPNQHSSGFGKGTKDHLDSNKSSS